MNEKIQNQIVEKLESQGYYGIDVSLRVSLFEQGLVVKELSNNDYECIFAVGYTESGQCNRFAVEDVDGDLPHNVINENWFELEGFLGFVGDDLEQWKNRSFVVKLHDLIHYYGHQNIVGTSVGQNAESLLKWLS